MSIAAASAPVRVREERGPAALLPVWIARLVGFAALGCLGVAQWQRMVDGLSLGRCLVWVALAAGAGAAVVACDRIARPRARAAALVGVAAAGLLAAYLAAGLDLELLRPRRLDDLGAGLGGGAQALSTVRLPYEGADPWPALTLQLLGSSMLMISALLAFWPRGERGSARGYPFLALAVLLVLAASPVVSLGGTRPLLLGAGLTLLTATFLWLEKLPLRPGLGVAALIGLALVGALPLAAAADRGEPWFDYQSFAEGLGPKDPVSFDWGHGDYGPISWSRSGAEVVRVKAARPAYWKVRTLDEFDGSRWDSGGFDRDSDDPTLDLPPNWETQDRFRDRIQVSVQRLRGSDVVGAGTTLNVDNSTRPIEHGIGPGEWESAGDLRNGDSYRAEVYVPRPTAQQLAAVPAAPSTEQSDDLQLRVRFDPAQVPPSDAPLSTIDNSPPQTATIEFQPFGRVGVVPVADYRDYAVSGDGDAALRASQLSRAWALSKRLRAATTTPYEYVLAVSAYLRRGFTYTEKPPAPAPGVHPLESFLFDTKAGYCQHYSAATALLLRMGGIPARVATGFSPGGYSKRRGAWIVRDTDAHSWVEVWFDGFGWVTVDTTPSATPARSQIAALAAPSQSDAASAAADAAAAEGDGGTGSSDPRAAGSREELFNRLRGGSGGTDEELGDDGSGGGVPVWAVAPIALLLCAGAGVLAVRRRRRLPDDPLERAVYELETALRRSGRSTAPGMTLRQLEARLGLSGEAAAYLRAVSAGRYASASAPPTNAQRRALRRELASGLGLAGRLRTFWALPPRAR